MSRFLSLVLIMYCGGKICFVKKKYKKMLNSENEVSITTKETIPGV